MGDWQQLSQMVVQAAVVVGFLGAAVASMLEVIKAALERVTGWKIEPDIMIVVSAVICAGLTAAVLVHVGAPWEFALVAALVAVFAPKAAHDAMGRLAGPRLMGAVMRQEDEGDESAR